MSTQGKVNKRLFRKTELTTQKVELAIIDEIQQLTKQGQKISDQMKQNADKAEKVFQSVNQENKKLRNKIDALKAESITKYVKAHGMFKELGMQVPSSLQKSVDAFSDIKTTPYVSNNSRIFG